MFDSSDHVTLTGFLCILNRDGPNLERTLFNENEMVKIIGSVPIILSYLIDSRGQNIENSNFI